MNKLNLLVVFGGHSPEYGVSLESAYAVLKNLDRKKYWIVMVGISADGRWFYFDGDIEKIRENIWQNDADCVPAALSPNVGKRTLLAFYRNGVREFRIDAAFPILHGKNGEDGTLQGMIELAQIPLVGCGTLASALCMDKDRAHKLASLAGVSVPRSVVLHRSDENQMELMSVFAEQVGFPVYVKPVGAGSSYGVTRVNGTEQLEAAAALAFGYDERILLEEGVTGFEVGCAVLGNSELFLGEVDEIELSGGFFDYTEKYTLQSSEIHVPARISAEMSKKVKEAARKVYKALGCSVFARVDLFLTPAGRIFFNEVNTIPGFTEHSRYPGMMMAAGLPFGELLDRMIGHAVAE